MSGNITTFWIIFGLLTAVGCSNTYPVSGTVSFDDKPLEIGTIILGEADGGPGLVSGGIENAQYKLMSKAGKKKVMITCYRPVPGGTGPQPAVEQFIPDRYNYASELTIEVKAGGENRFNFDLKK
jgi:hypothetical protein